MDTTDTNTAPASPPNVATLCGQEIILRPPGSLTTCREVLMAALHNHQRACYAALALCWLADPREKKRKKGEVKVCRPAVTYSGCDYNPLRLGGEFADDLFRQGVPYHEVLAAGVQAFLLLSDALPNEDEEARAEGN